MKGETELIQLTIVPELPVSISVPLVEPEQIVDPPATEPPTEPGFTVTVVVDEVAAVQDPF